MPPLILLALLAGLPLILTTLLRVKPLYLFVSIVIGYFWVQYLGESAELVMRSLVQVSHPDVVIRLGLLLVPFVLTLLFMRKTLSTSALPFQFILLVADSALLTLFLLPLLTPGTQGAIYQTHAGNVVRQAHDVAIVAVAALHLIVMYMTKPASHVKGHHGRHK
ncbi:MAG TPA: hypothetical protein VLE74_00130 [Candidatus Saccharimonadales bacterium]|nr:hypothetical protein [Candidatus Saccharimonadales bacterium]